MQLIYSVCKFQDGTYAQQNQTVDEEGNIEFLPPFQITESQYQAAVTLLGEDCKRTLPEGVCLEMYRVGDELKN